MQLLWAKVKEGAKIPTKRSEDAGYDLYPCFEEEYMEILPLHTVMIPLGVASAFDEGYVIFLKERGSSGTKGMAQRAGVIDSGYRGEYMCPITNVNEKPLRIIKNTALNQMKKEDQEKYILYPYEKAVCQGVLLQAPNVESKEVSMEELLSISSRRMEGRLGSSGK